MCGICGVICTEGDASRHETAVHRMMDCIAHRGPDGDGYLALDNAALGHRRLSIIDPSNGHQPMRDAEAELTITFNGEIYGFMDVRTSLEGMGFSFATGTDTEVLLKLYRRYGTDMLQHVSGAFAFCIWDAKQKRAFFARDRFGEKPLYYLPLDNGRTVAFCSEIEGLSAAFEFDRHVDDVSLVHFLARGFVQPHRTIFDAVRTLPPGSAMIIEDGKARVWEYWKIPMPTARLAASGTLGLADAAEAFREILLNVVRKQLVADVPVSFFLSGGLDSSSIVSLASEVGFEGRVFNFRHSEDQSELKFAQLVAERSGVPLSVLDMPSGDPLELFEQATGAYGEPFWDSSLLGVFNVCASAAVHSKVIVSGDGADELLGGYVWWYSQVARLEEIRDMSLIEFLASMPAAATAWILTRTGMGPRANRNPFDARLIWDRTRGRTPGSVREAQKWGGVEETILALGLSSESIKTARDESGMTSEGSDLAAVLHNDQTNYLCGNMMVKTDRASMRNGIEVRCPFLDHHLVEHLADVPIDFKLTSRSDKVLLRESMKHDLPNEVLVRDKQGFGVQRHDMEESRRIATSLESKLCASDPAVGRIVDKDVARSLAAASPGRARSLLVLTNWAEKHL